MKQLFDFYRSHIRMSVYGVRCNLFNQLGVDADSDWEHSTDPAIQEIVPALQKIDAALNEGFIMLDQTTLDGCGFTDDTPVLAVTVDHIRRVFQDTAGCICGKFDAVMTDELVTKRLLQIALQRRQEAERQQPIKQVDTDGNPATIIGSVADMRGAETIAISKDGVVSASSNN